MKNFSSQSELTAHVTEVISADFRQRAMRMLPLGQAEVDAAVTKAKALIKSSVQSMRNHSDGINKRAMKDAQFLNHLVLAGALRSAINSRRHNQE